MDKKTIKKVAISSHKKLVEEIKNKISDNFVNELDFIEEVAYTFFIRFSALCYMQKNDIFPNEKISYSSIEKLTNLFPDIFCELTDGIKLLFPQDFFDDNPFSAIADSDWKEIEILGWLYQYYFSEKHHNVVDTLHFKAYDKKDVPVATQLFTPDWVVKFIVENSLGRYWMERNPKSKLKESMQFYIPVDQYINEKILPQDLTFFDCCMGSGNFLIYSFDLLIKIYLECGASPVEAAESILSNNLYGVDIDDKSTQLAHFSLLMKGVQYSPSLISKSVHMNLYEIPESNGISKKNEITELFYDAKEYGSIMTFDNKSGFSSNVLSKESSPFECVATLLTKKYKVVATNPPYFNKYSPKLKQYLSKHYKDYSGDMFSVFIRKNLDFCEEGGYSGYMTPNVWMFIKAYEALRAYVLNNTTITSLVQMAKGAFFKEATVDVCAFILKNEKANEKGTYFRLENFKGDMSLQGKKVLEALSSDTCDYLYKISQDDFLKLPSFPIAYWLSDAMMQAFDKNPVLSDKGIARNGMKTGDNGRFVKYWWEVPENEVNFSAKNAEEAYQSGAKWFPYNKGGEYRKWYGNNYYLINWEDKGSQVIGNAKNDKRHVQDYPNTLKFIPAISWSLITSSKPSFRLKEHCISDIAGMCFYPQDDNLLCYLAFLNSVVAEKMLSFISPTINFQSGDIAKLPVSQAFFEQKDVIKRLASRAILLSKQDWDSFELSWDFKKHPLVPNGKSRSLEAVYKEWEEACEKRYEELKSIEEAINEIFINAYGLQSCLSCKVNSVSLGLADKKRDIKSLISYAIGCMLGRYSFANEFPVCDKISLTDDSFIVRFKDFLTIAYGRSYLEENLSFVASALCENSNDVMTIKKYFIKDFYSDHLKLYKKRAVYHIIDDALVNGLRQESKNEKI